MHEPGAAGRAGGRQFGHDHRVYHRGEAHHRADREVDAAGDDHEGDAERGDGDERKILRYVLDVAFGQEVRRGKVHHHDQEDQRDRDVAGLRGEDAAAPPFGLADIGEGNCAFHGHGHHAASLAPVISAVTSSGEVSPIGLSARFSPRRITTTRSETAKTSGMRCEISMTAMPCSLSRWIRLSTCSTWRTEIAAV